MGIEKFADWLRMAEVKWDVGNNAQLMEGKRFKLDRKNQSRYVKYASFITECRIIEMEKLCSPGFFSA